MLHSWQFISISAISPGFSVHGWISLLDLRLISGRRLLIQNECCHSKQTNASREWFEDHLSRLWCQGMSGCPHVSCPELLKFEHGLHVTVVQTYFDLSRNHGCRHLHEELTPHLCSVRIQTFELNGWTIQPLIPWSPGSFTRPSWPDEKKTRIYGTWFVGRMLVDVDLLRARHATHKCLSSHAAAKVSKDLRRLAKRLQKTWSTANSSNSLATDSWDCSKYIWRIEVSNPTPNQARSNKYIC